MENNYKNIFHKASVAAVELYTRVPINTPSVKELKYSKCKRTCKRIY